MTFPAGTGSPNSQVGPNYGCLISQPTGLVLSANSTKRQRGGKHTTTTGRGFYCLGAFSTLAGNCGNLTATTRFPIPPNPLTVQQYQQWLQLFQALPVKNAYYFERSTSRFTFCWLPTTQPATEC